ncbi:MAG: hypothetical protein ACRD1Z_11605, partial [Vicinamibacteria bacterium]
MFDRALFYFAPLILPQAHEPVLQRFTHRGFAGEEVFGGRSTSFTIGLSDDAKQGEMEEARPGCVWVDEDSAGEGLPAESGADETTQAFEDRLTGVEKDRLRLIRRLGDRELAAHVFRVRFVEGPE